MTDSTQVVNISGAILANLINILAISIFIARLSHKPKLEYWFGIVLVLTSVPLTYLLITAIGLKRPPLYFIQIGLMMAYLVFELVLDYVLKVDFRQLRWLVIPYVILFFAGTGGMIGVSRYAGKTWVIVTVLTFLVMATLSFIQHFLTGQ